MHIPYPETEEGVGELRHCSWEPGLPSAIIVDIDGTVALRGDRNPFDETRVSEDKPNEPIMYLVHKLSGLVDQVLFVSARTDACYEDTYSWLEEYAGLPEGFKLLMRKHGDKRKDWKVKAEIFDNHVRGKYNVPYVLDDRDQVVEMWRKIGLTCLQVADGKF